MGDDKAEKETGHRTGPKQVVVKSHLLKQDIESHQPYYTDQNPGYSVRTGTPP